MSITCRQQARSNNHFSFERSPVRGVATIPNGLARVADYAAVLRVYPSTKAFSGFVNLDSLLQWALRHLQDTHVRFHKTKDWAWRSRERRTQVQSQRNT